MPTKSVDLPHLRNVVLAGHAAAGKTTLAEQLLFRTGALPRLGKVDDGTASLDFEPEEQKRHESLSLAVASLDDEGTRVTLLDTPGYADFVAEVIQGFAAADGALLVMDASGGVESGLEKAVALGRSTGRAACFFINKCDRENADPNAALDALRSSFGTPPGDRGRGVVLRLRRSRPPQGIPLGRQAGDRDSDPRRARWGGRPATGPAAGGRRRSRRRRPDEVPGRRGHQRPGAGGVPSERRQGVGPCAGARGQRDQGRRAAGATRNRAPPGAPGPRSAPARGCRCSTISRCRSSCRPSSCLLADCVGLPRDISHVRPRSLVAPFFLKAAGRSSPTMELRCHPPSPRHSSRRRPRCSR